MTGQPPDLLPGGLGLPQDVGTSAAPMWPQDHDTLARLQELDRRMRDPVESKRAVEELRTHFKGMVTLLDAQWQQKQLALAQMDARDQIDQRASEGFRAQERAADLMTEMRTSGLRSPDLERAYDDQIVAMQGTIPDELHQQLRETRQRIADFRDLAPALRYTLGNAGFREDQETQTVGGDSPQARGLMGYLTAGTMPMDLQSRLARSGRREADKLESSFFDTPREFARQHVDMRGVYGALGAEDYLKGEQERVRQSLRLPLEDLRQVNAPVGYQPETKTVQMPKGMTREMFHLATADAIISNLKTHLGGKASLADEAEHLGTMIGQLPIFGSLTSAGGKAAEGVKRLWKSAPKAALKMANYGVQGFLAYELGANVIDPSPVEMEELQQLPEGMRKKREEALRQRNGVATAAILPIMAAMSSPLRPSASAGRKGLLNRGAMGAIGAIAESGAEGALTGLAMPAAGELADAVARNIPNEQGQLLADMYAAHGVYGPLERLWTAVEKGDSAGAEQAARDYASAAGSAVVGFGAIHALKAAGALRTLNGRDKIRMFVRMSKDLEQSGLPKETRDAIADQGQKILEEVSKTKAEDEPRVVAERLAEAEGGHEQARAAVDDRHSAEDLPNHPGKTLEDKAQAIEQKLTESRMSDGVDDPAEQLKQEAEAAALESEMLAVRAKKKGDEERAQQHLEHARALRAGEADPRDTVPDESTPESQAAAEAARARVDIKREAKGADTAKQILAEREAEAAPETATKAQEPPAEPAQAGDAAPAPHPKPRTRKVDLEPQLLDDARAVRRQHGEKATPRLLSKALGITEAKAKRVHAEIAKDAPEAPPPAAPPPVTRPKLDVGGWARSTPEHAAGGKDILGRIVKVEGDTVTVKPRSGKKVTLHRDDLRAIDPQSVADHALMARKANASKASKAKLRPKPDDDVLTFIAKLGGISHEAAKEGGNQFTDERGRKVGVLRVFTEKGMGWDRLAQNLAESGYMQGEASGGGYGPHEAQELVSRALAGEGVFSREENERRYSSRQDMQEWQAEYDSARMPMEQEGGAPPAEVPVAEHPTAADAVQPSGVEAAPTPAADVTGPQKLELRTKHKELAAKVRDLKKQDIKTEEDADRAYAELLKASGNEDRPGGRKVFEGVVRDALGDIRNQEDWAAFVEHAGPYLRGPEGQALQFSKEGRELLDRMKRMQKRFVGEAGVLYFPLDEIADVLMPSRERTVKRIERWADTLNHPVPVRGGLSLDLGDAFRTLHGRLGVVGTTFSEMSAEINARMAEIKWALGTLRGEFPRGGPEHNLKGLVEALGKKPEDRTPAEVLALAGMKPKTQKAVESVVTLLGKFREVVANYRDGVAQMRLFHRDMEQHVERDSARIEKAKERLQDAHEMVGETDPKSDEGRAARNEVKNAQKALKAAEEALLRSERRRNEMAARIRDRIAEFGREGYFPHVPELSKKELKELYQHSFDAPPDLGSSPTADGGYRIGSELRFASSGHAKRREGTLEAEGQLMRDDLDALYYYFADVVPKAMHNKWLLDNYDALHGRRRMLTDEDLKKGRGMGIVIQRRDPDHYSEHRVRGGYWKVQTPWGSVLTKSKLTPAELAKWLLRDGRIKTEMAEAKAEGPEALEAFISKVKEAAEMAEEGSDYGIVVDSPHTRDMPRDAWSGDRIGWFESRAGLDHVPLHKLTGTMWEREGGLRQQLLNLGTNGARQWLEIEKAQRDVLGYAAEDAGAIAPVLRKLSKSAAWAITSLTIGMGNMRSAIAAYFGAMFANSLTMGVRASLRHAPMMAKHLKQRLLHKTSFDEWVRDLKVNLDDPSKPLWQNEALRAKVMATMPQKTPLERAQAAAVWLWQTSPYYAATVRGTTAGGDAGVLQRAKGWLHFKAQGGDIGGRRAKEPEWVPGGVRSAARYVRRFAGWFGDTGQYIFWHGLESNMRGHLYMGTVVDALMSGKSEAEAVRLANRATVAAHGSFGRILKSPVMRSALLAPLGSVTNWMQHTAGTNVRLLLGPRGRGVPVPQMGDASKVGAAEGMLVHANMWVRQMALVQVAAALGLAFGDDRYGRDVTAQIGGRMRDIPGVGESLEAAVEDASSRVWDALGVTADRYPKLHDLLSWKSTDVPTPVVPGGFSGPAMTFLRYGAQFVMAVLEGDDRARDMAAARLQSTALGSNYRLFNRAFNTRKVYPDRPQDDTYETIEPFTGRTLERIHGSGLTRILMDLLPGVPIEESINYEVKRRAQRAGDRLAREGANFNAKARALYHESQSAQDPRRKAEAEQELNALIEQQANDRHWTRADYQSFWTNLDTTHARDRETGLVRRVLDMPTQESKLELLLDLIERGMLDERQATYIRGQLIGRRTYPGTYFREVGQELTDRYDRVWSAARESWRAQGSPR